MEPLLGFKLKVVENAGTSLGQMLSNKNPWAGSKCGRPDCFPCKQQTEHVENCGIQNVVYESRCNVCNLEEKGKKEKTLEDTRPLPSIYVGESSRSLKERSKEHHADYSKMQEDSHMLKDRPSFNQYVISSHKSCLERQIGEAVRIQLRGNTLNSVGVYNRSKLTRLVVDSEWDKRVFNSNWKTPISSVEKMDDLSSEGADSLENVQRGVKRSPEARGCDDP